MRTYSGKFMGYDDCYCPLCKGYDGVIYIPLPSEEEGKYIEVPVMKFGTLGIQHVEIPLDAEYCLRYWGILHITTKALIRSDYDTYLEAYSFIQEAKHLPWERETIECHVMEIYLFMKRQSYNKYLDRVPPEMGPRVLVGKRLRDYQKAKEFELQGLMAGIQ